MQFMSRISSCTRSAVRLAARLLAATLLATVAGPLAVRAQLIYTGGTGQIAFSVQPIVTYGGVPPLWTGDTFTTLNDIMSSPGGTFNSFYGASPNPAFFNTGVVPLGAGIWGAAPPQSTLYGPFGGGYMGIAPGAANFSISDPAAGGTVSVGTEASSANYTVGALGLSGNFGTYLSVGGFVNPDSAVAASLVTYVNVFSPADVFLQTYGFDQILAASGSTSGNKFVVWSGQFSNIPQTVGGVVNGFVIYTGAGPTQNFTGFAAGATGVNLAAGDLVNITSVLTVIADPYSEINIGGLPDPSVLAANDVTLPTDGELFNSDPTLVPEPAVPMLAGAGLLATLIVREVRRRAVV